MRRISMILTAAILLSLPVLAADLGVHNDWDKSPQGWFMTRAERTQWATLTSEAEAAKFIADFLAKRDPKFADEIALRVKKADQYFTVAGTRGSQALRGKVVILLGPPSSMDISAKKTRANAGRSASLDTSVNAGGGGTGAGLADVAEVDQRSAMHGAASTVDKLYTITYGSEQLPTKKGLSVVVEVDGKTGTDTIRDKRALAELEKTFEAIAEASIKR